MSASAVTLDAGQAFSVTATLAGSPALQWTLSGTSCTGTGCGTVSTTSGATTVYTAPAGLTAQLAGVVLTASVPGTRSSATVAITVNPDPVISGTPPFGIVGTAYSATLTAAGGTAPLKWSLLSGTLPAGLTFNATTGVISGTPTAAGTSSFAVQVVDSSSVPYTVMATETIVVVAPLTLTGSTPAGRVGAAYTGSLAAAGGTGPYTFSVASGALPAGLTLSSAGAITGTPTTAGTFAFSGQVQDANGTKTTANFSITVAAALALTTTSLPNGTVGVPYSATIGVTGGTVPYTCAFTAGTLPAGLTLSGCVVSGTPTAAGTSSLTVRATDSSSPAATVSGPESITIAPAPLAITTGTLPNGTVGVAYSSTIGVSGGTAPYTCTITNGTLPAGLTLGANCLVSGTPTVAGTSNLTVRATDSGNPALTATGPVAITIAPAATLTISSPPGAVVGTPYTGTIPVTGGTGPYTCKLTSGTLPGGLTLNGCVVSGTPTTAGSTTVTVQATDSSSPATTGTGPVTLVVSPAPLAITTGTLPNGTVGVAYSSTIGVSGGTSPYTCTITNGTLPAGLTLGANCLVSGTPTVAGTSNLTVKATDSGNPANTTTGPVAVTIAPAPLAITTGTLPNGTVGVAYSSTIGVSGGTSPYTCTITNGTLPAGLTLGANCLVSGTPTVAGTSNLTVKATDSGNPTLTTTGPVAVTIVAGTGLVVASPPAGTVGAPYTGTVPVSGGTGPYTCTLTSGTVPAGLTLNNCTLTGTPTAPGSTTFVLGVGDSSQPPKTGSGPVTVTINPATTVLTLGNPPAATVGTPYTGTIPVAGGTAPYTCTASTALPAGLTLNANCTVTGTPTTPGSTTVTVTATDSGNPKGTVTGPVVVTVQPVPALTLTGSVPNATVGVAYSQTLQATGGIAPYTYAVTSGALPAGLTLSAGGVISGTPTTPGASSFSVTATDTESTPQTATLPLVILVTYPVTAQDGLLSGPYAFLFQGYDDVAVGLAAFQTATVGSFTANGAGVVANGELDSNHQGSNPAGATVASNTFVGTYTVGADLRGSLTLSTLNANGTVLNTHTYAIALKAAVAPATASAQGSLIEFDGNQVTGTRGSGTLLRQTAGSFTTGLAGSYVFGLQGDTPCLPTCTLAVTPGPVAAVGQFTAAAGAITGASDANIATGKLVNLGLTGSYGAADGNGRVQMSLTTAGTLAGVYPSDYAVYVVNANQAFVMSTDKHSAAILLAGSTQLQTLASFGASSLTGPFIGYENAPTNPGLAGTTVNNTLNFSTATVFRTTGDGAGTCTVTNVDEGGTTALVNGVSGVGSGAPVINALLGTYQSLGPATCATAQNGRVVLNYPVPGTVLATTLGLLGLGNTPPPARVVYLSGVDRGYFLETGYAGLGQIEPQTGAPYTIASFSGAYVYQEIPASSLATTNNSGVIVANGAGSATSTQDLNVGVGTINVLQAGVTQTQPYTAPDATTGRFTLNTTVVVYEISPGRFVLVDTNPLATSPSVIVLY